MHRKSSCLGPCALLILFALIHTTNGSPEGIIRKPRRLLELEPRRHFGRFNGTRRDSAVECSSGWFKCHSGECVSIYDLCDAVRDCDDGSDEENCPEEMECDERSQGRCRNGRCVYKFADCTGRDSCGDGSRNENCTMCRASGVLCPNKRCIHSDERCTGMDACGDGSSNLNCTMCNNRAVHFPKSGRCIPHEDVCSGFDVIGDGESDSNCSACKQGAKLCANKKCVRPELWCNGEDVCGDDSSYKNCTRCQNNAQLTDDHWCVIPASPPHSPSHTHHGKAALPAHHHFTYGFIIGAFALISIVAVSVIALYLIYPSKFRWIHRRGETGLVM